MVFLTFKAYKKCRNFVTTYSFFPFLHVDVKLLTSNIILLILNHPTISNHLLSVGNNFTQTFYPLEL